jgi:hypothetical protein
MNNALCTTGMSYFVTTIGIARLWPRSTVHANTLVALESTTMSDLIPEAFSYALLRFVCKLSNCVVGLAALKMSLWSHRALKITCELVHLKTRVPRHRRSLTETKVTVTGASQGQKVDVIVTRFSFFLLSYSIILSWRRNGIFIVLHHTCSRSRVPRARERDLLCLRSTTTTAQAHLGFTPGAATPRK